MWVRGLKLNLSLRTSNLWKVAPHVGAWIETADSLPVPEFDNVAPHVGAWIETHTT